jgi:membrane-bound lytic murein transglycosylase D
VVLADGDEAPEETPELLADPSDYSVEDGGLIAVQAAETLGHYAEWADVRASALRRLNGLRYGQPLPLGQRLRIDLSRVDADTFEGRRVAYHRGLQAAYFVDNHIRGECVHPLRPGESLWTLATRVYGVPLWLLRQYNPDIDFHGVLPPGTPVRVPVVGEEGRDGAADGACRRA